MAVTPNMIAVALGVAAPESGSTKFEQWSMWITDAQMLIEARKAELGITEPIDEAKLDSTDSLCPICASPGLMMSALPPMSAIPVAKETRVLVEVLSKMTATVWRPLPSAAKGCTL